MKKTKKVFASAKEKTKRRKAVLVSIAIVLVVAATLFIKISVVNRDEEFYTTAVPPQFGLTDGEHYVTGVIKAKDWYYKGKGNKFYPSRDEDISAITGDASYNAHNPPGNIQANPLEYSGELVLKCSSEHYPDRIDLDICKKEAGILVPLESSLESSKSNSGDKTILFIETETSLSGYPVFQPKEKGELIYRITAYWDETKSGERAFYGKAEYEFSFINKVPIEFEISSYESFPGELLAIFAKYAGEDDNISIESDLINQEIPFYEYEEGKFAIIPLSYDLVPSEYVISLTLEKDSNSSLEKNQSPLYHEIKVNILPKDFPIQYLTISEEVDKATRNDSAYEEYDKYIGVVRKTNTPIKMWEGLFIKPVEGRITTEFGMRRFVNNSPTSYRHSGIDIAANRGTPVMAANSGKVIFAKHLTLTGNTVLIDHGYGIISWSYHLDSIKVEEDEDVKKGQIIGEVGSTGFSTGPHLHFAISVHDVFTNPWTLFEQEPVLFK